MLTCNCKCNKRLSIFLIDYELLVFLKTDKINTMEITQSTRFKKMAFNAIVAVIAFILVYILLILLAVSLTVACVIGGGLLILVFHNFISIILGLMLISLSFFILAFLFKYFFKRHKTDLSNLKEIDLKNYPALFSLIDGIIRETGTNFPKKVYLSEEVNASVFYDSGFWSLFLPVRKNLHIGIGLVNALTVQELKAILAHEFGHFSQRSMSVGSYVYYVNQIIYNMLYDNDSFNLMIQRWANASGYFAVSVKIAVAVIGGVQWILEKMYGFVNLHFMALSREMEFHADEVAAHVAGSRALEDALVRFDLTELAMNEVHNFYGERVQRNIDCKNIYANQIYVLNSLARRNKIPVKNDLPYIPLSAVDHYRLSKLNIEERWASHPSIQDRMLALENLNITKNEDRKELAIVLFPDVETIFEDFTRQIFSRVIYSSDDANLLSQQEFESEYEANACQYAFPAEYNGYYDNHTPQYFDTANLTESGNDRVEVSSLFGNELTDAIRDFRMLENDENTLSCILNGEISTRGFNYDGQKYKSRDAEYLITELQRKKEEVRQMIKENDITIYRTFYQQAKLKGKGPELKDRYTEFFRHSEICNKRVDIYNEIISATNFMRGDIDHQYLSSYFRILSRVEEKLRSEIKVMLEDLLSKNEMPENIKVSFDTYLSRNWSYAANESADAEYLDVLFNAISGYNYMTSKLFFVEKFNLLNYQINISQV